MLTLDQLTPPRSGRHADIFRRVGDFIDESGCLGEAEKLVVAVSGGADSTALALVLSYMRLNGGLDFALAHFNHRLRAKAETSGDREFVEALAERLGVAIYCGEGDVRQHATQYRISLEDAGRRLRYSFLREQALSFGATAVAVGHTASDQAETVLFRIIRGTGIEGLRAMLPRARWPFEGEGPDIVRPLLAIVRDDTEFYCREFGISPRVDPTNFALDATRNRIRLQVLALLRELNPRVDERLVWLARTAEGYAGYVERQADELWPTIAREEGNHITFPRERFDALEFPLRSQLLITAYRKLAQGRGEIGSVHIDRALSMGRMKRSWRMSLPGCVHFRAGGRNIRVISGKEEPPSAIPEGPLNIPGRTQVRGWTIDAEIVTLPEDPRTNDPYETFLDAAKTCIDLTIRSRRPGDRLRPLGLGGEKKLQDILVDAKVPAAERGGVPLICGPEGIIWIAGHCIDERYALDIDSRQALHLTASPITDNR